MAKKTSKSAKPAKKAAKKVVKKAVKKVVGKAAKAPAKKSAAKRVTAVKKAAPNTFALQSVAPGFTSNDSAASVKWYCDVLGFTIIEKWERDGVFHGAAIGRDAVRINIGQDDWKMGRDRIKGQGTRMYIQTSSAQGIDAYAASIKAAGGVLDQEVTEGWGMRVFSITDPDGFKLTFMADLKK